MKKFRQLGNQRRLLYFLMVFFSCMLFSACQAGEDVVVRETGGGSETETAVEESKTGQMVCVYVCGEVKEPGVYRFDPGKRIGDAIDAAGGMKKKADREALNLAEQVQDGQMIRVPARGESDKDADEEKREETDCPTGDDPGDNGTKIDINTADSPALQQIPGVGAARAESIIAYREENGKFAKPEDIMNVSGIGQGIFLKMKAYIKV